MSAIAKPERRVRIRWAFLLGLLILVGGPILFLLLPRRHPPPSPALSQGRNLLATGVAGRRMDEALLNKLAWADVVPTAEGLGTDKGWCEEVVALAGRMRHPPVLYLRGLLLLATNELASALATFLLIPVAEIPATHLYAPFRLHYELRPAEPNPFQAAISRAVAQNQVPPLIQARVLAGDGRLREALKAYLKTDPAEWASLDVRVLRGLRLHAALGGDTAAMLQAGLSGGRVRRDLRPQIVEVVNAPLDQATMEDLKNRMLRQIDGDPALRRAALTGAVQQLTVRQQFVGRKYRELLDQQGARPALDQPDETVLMLTLAAARLQDAAAFERWSQELKRRYPTSEIEQWLNQLRTPTPSRAP